MVTGTPSGVWYSQPHAAGNKDYREHRGNQQGYFLRVSEILRVMGNSVQQGIYEFFFLACSMA